MCVSLKVKILSLWRTQKLARETCFARLGRWISHGAPQARLHLACFGEPGGLLTLPSCRVNWGVVQESRF